MLRGASLGLAARGYAVSVVARRQSRLDALVRAAAGLTGVIHPIALDYRDTDALTAALAAARSRLGPIGLALENIRYREIILGFVLEGDRSRWLTDAEISAGVLAAVDADQPRYIVGTVRPWHLRP